MKRVSAEITRSMVAMGMPPERAERKVAETRKGIIYVGLGAFFILLGFGLAIVPYVVTKTNPPALLLALAAVSAVPGAYLLLAGGNLISRDAMRAAEQSGSVITRTAAKVLNRGRKDTPPPEDG